MLEVKKGGAMPWGLYEGPIGYKKKMLEVKKGGAMPWGFYEGTIGNKKMLEVKKRGGQCHGVSSKELSDTPKGIITSPSFHNAVRAVLVTIE